MSVRATTLLSLLSLTSALGTNLTLGAGTPICTSILTNTHEACCATGMFSIDGTGAVAYHKYVIYDYFSEGPTGTDSWNRWKDSCKSDGGKLLVLENRAEMNCIIKYMVDQYSYGSTARTDLFAIGLHAQSRFPGVYEWDGLETAYDSAAHTGLADDATPSFTNWKDGSTPSGDNACVVMSLGNTGVVGGWETVACNADTYYAICEMEG